MKQSDVRVLRFGNKQTSPDMQPHAGSPHVHVLIAVLPPQAGWRVTSSSVLFVRFNSDARQEAAVQFSCKTSDLAVKSCILGIFSLFCCENKALRALKDF